MKTAKLKKNQQQPKRKQMWFRMVLIAIVSFVSAGIVGGTLFLVQMKQYAVREQHTEQVTQTTSNTDVSQNQFPVGVDPKNKTITENPIVDAYFENHISTRSSTMSLHTSWFGKLMGKLALSNLYQNLASLSSRVLVIQSGERKEQVAQNFKKILGWDKGQQAIFLDLINKASPEIGEGKFFPGTYTVPIGASPETVATLISDRFNAEVLARYGATVEAVVPLSDTLTIASLLEREAYDFDDMRLISGIIWNRLFIGMNLQIDATLQYAKGSKSSETWWPRVNPSDKYIASVYNTYKNRGLPPAPIANPSLDAILATLNPKQTDCMYYFHDRNANFHCSETYEQHVALIKQYY